MGSLQAQKKEHWDVRTLIAMDDATRFPTHGFAKGGIGYYLSTHAKGGIASFRENCKATGGSIPHGSLSIHGNKPLTATSSKNWEEVCVPEELPKWQSGLG